MGQNPVKIKKQSTLNNKHNAMKIIAIISLALMVSIPTMAQRNQYHIRVECNPDNNGQVNTRWVNNYIITYTWDNWKHSAPILAQQDYVGQDDNGIDYYSSYYQKVSFRHEEDAIDYAKQLTSLADVNYHLAYGKEKHKKLTIKYKMAAKKLCFGCKPIRNEAKCCRVKDIY